MFKKNLRFNKTNNDLRNIAAIKTFLTQIKIGDKKQYLRKKVESPFFQRAKSNFYNTVHYNTIQCKH
jgi:hypothetical protein